MISFFERVAETSAYRLCRSLVLVLAALYVLMVAVNGIPYRGLGLLGFTLQSLRSDLIDMLSLESHRLFSYGLGIGTRPTRYALICEEHGQATEADNAATEGQVRGQLVENKSGVIYNSMAAAFERGESQPVKDSVGPSFLLEAGLVFWRLTPRIHSVGHRSLTSASPAEYPLDVP